MAFSKDAKTFKIEMFRKKKYLIIFNQENFDGYEKRLGTEKDVEALRETFGALDFDIDPHNDFTKNEIFETIRSLPSRRNNLSDYEYMVVTILTHGSRNRLRARDQQYSDTDIIKDLVSVNQATAKPIVLIIQACRGTKSVLGYGVFDISKTVKPYSLPIEADWLIHRVFDYPSHRNRLHKSPIQKFCDKLDDLWATQDLESILTVFRRDYKTSEMGIVPNTTSTCIRKLNSGKSSKIESLLNQPRSNINPEVIKNDLDNAETKPFSYFMDHFSCVKKRLKFFVERNPLHDLARLMWQVATLIKDDDDFNPIKKEMCEKYSKYLYNDFQHTSLQTFTCSCAQCPICT